MAGSAALLPRRAPWWLLGLVTPLALWSVWSDLQSARTGPDQLLRSSAVVLITFGCVVALRWAGAGTVLVVLGSFLTLSDPVPVAPVFFVVAGLIVAFTGNVRILFALGAANVLWSLANVVVVGPEYWFVDVLSLVILGAIIAIRRQVSSLGRSVQNERDRAERAVEAQEQAAEQERRRLARELHDVVAHDVTVIAMQCDAALLDEDAAGRTQALELVSGAAHRALGDLRRMMNVLTVTELDPGGARISSDLRSEIDEVANRLRGLGLDVRVAVDSAAGDQADQVVLLALVPVLRESATNVAKYADPDHPVLLSLSAVGARTRLRVSNGIAAAAAPAPSVLSGGFGLVCLDERLRSLDGTFSAGPVDGSWVLTAEVPTH